MRTGPQTHQANARYRRAQFRFRRTTGRFCTQNAMASISQDRRRAMCQPRTRHFVSRTHFAFVSLAPTKQRYEITNRTLLRPR